MGVRIQNEETVTELWLSLMAEGRRMHRRYSNNRGITFLKLRDFLKTLLGEVQFKTHPLLMTI